MPSLKDLRLRIVSVKSTRKITSAMKMVAASKLRRAQTAAEAARPFAERMERMLGTLAGSLAGQAGAPAMLAGNGKSDVHLIVMVTADRGLCGGFNSSIVRDVRRMTAELIGQGKTVKILPVGRKGREQIKRDFGSNLIEGFEGLGRKGITFPEADMVAAKVASMFEAGEFDVCTVVYNRFQSAISQIVTRQQLIPFAVAAGEEKSGELKATYEFEPNEEEILATLVPRNLAIQVFRATLESQASEQGARMTAMDNATRNAGDMINGLTIKYNRSRQAQITKELIEIISGAEAL
ncbi:F0F1 ATP synthase subunit gamma [Magnetospirillum sp. 64-120]|uniref:F0F1 ATP synthase subunit gamma n=1 Tax=Magnetospirillum sp. 64-120 TaxID=1895778 RepID=UPI000928A2A7|nr:F0F1 ATP synthase subunit gamma [Magnetospirillum sp. 64-120]OJX68521.1 MAG: F0F1 ATP synthase subunit gamma [Magnetospirillum sp. 64-120]